MRRAAIATATVAATTGALTLVLNGLVGSPDPDGPAPLRGVPAAATGLTPFTGCEELLDWYVGRALPHVGPYGMDGGTPYPLGGPLEDMRMPMAASGQDDEASGYADSVDAQTSSGTGTNVQESGVDEPDIAKTDGELVVQVRGRELVVTDVTGEAPRELSRLELPEAMHSPELLLLGDRVLVVQGGGLWGGPIPVEPGVAADIARPGYPAPPSDRSRVLEVSISNPESPTVDSDQTLGGSLLSARQYADSGADQDTVRLVLRTARPALDWVYPNRNRTTAQAKEENKDLVRSSTIEDWLPTTGAVEDLRPLVGCEAVHHPSEGDQLGTISVITASAGDLTTWRGTAITAGGDTVYSSNDRLYLTSWAGGDGIGDTGIHAFELTETDTRYVASGQVEGRLRDRWSMDEHDGVLRVAVAHGDGWGADENGVTTLREDGDELVELGSVRGLGPQEEIKSVRWFDDLAVVVTFRQTDPLYTVDLSDPSRPRTRGELKIPGFSRYLHPVGDDRLLGIGQDATPEGQELGGQAAVFDIGDLADPRRLDTVSLGRGSRATAEHDPRGFTWLPRQQVGLATVTDQWDGTARLLALQVAPDGNLEEGEEWALPSGAMGTARTLPLDGGRVALVATDVRLIHVG